LIEIAKKKEAGPVVCTWCNGTSHTKYGTYLRYAPASSERIDIQRYRCKHDCCRRTFSILPHPFLRITRYSICLFQALLTLFRQGGAVNPIAKTLGVGWATVTRALAQGELALEWIREEAKADPSWSPSPCTDPARHWTHFTRMFAAKFYPKRYAM
jgi:transposase-like protein